MLAVKSETVTDKKTKRIGLIVAVTASFITPFMISAVNVALPAIEKTFNIDAVLLSWVATAYLLASAVSLVPFGRIADIYGRKKIIIWGFSVLALSSLLCALSHSVVLLISVRVIQGIGSGMIFATYLAILVSIYPPQERGKAIGITVSAVYIGLSCGPFIGGVLTMHLTWRSLFFLVFLMSIAVICMLSLGLKAEWAEAGEEKIDLPGTFIYSGTLVAIIYGITLLPSITSIWLILLGLVGLIVFIKWELKIDYPVFDLSLFQANRAFAFSNLAALIYYSAVFGITFILSLYLQYVKGLDPQTAGLVLVAQPITMAIFSPIAGRLSDRIEPRLIASSGMFITCVCFFMLSRVDQNSHYGQIVGYLFVLGFGYALFASPNMNAILSSVGKKQLGIASGVAGTMRVLGQMFSMGIATVVISIIMGRVQFTVSSYKGLVESTSTIFVIFGILCLIGIFVSLVRGSVRN